MKLTFSHTSLKSLWNEAVRQWPIAVRPLNGQRSPCFWLVGGEGIYLMHNGAMPKGGSTLAYANECNPLKMSFPNWLGVKRAVLGDSDSMELVEIVVVGTAVDAGCEIEVTFERDTMTVTVVENGQAGLRWQSLRTRHARGLR
jgi:hypothetical protein